MSVRVCGDVRRESPAGEIRRIIMTAQHIQIAIKATPQAVWNALVDPTLTPAYYIGFVAEFDLTAGAPYRYTAGGGDMITGRVLEVEANHKLVTTFNGHWAPDVAELPESKVSFEIFEPFMPMPGVTFLSCRHEGLDASETAAHLEIGWVSILSGLKTLLETGKPLVSMN
jgi:uncharacterized protein YndB with AHSA1/START domain